VNRETNLYEILGVSPTSESVVVEAAYRALMRRYQSEAASNPDVAAQIQKINAAYSTLSNPRKRANYDAGLRSRPSQEKVTETVPLRRTQKERPAAATNRKPSTPPVTAPPKRELKARSAATQDVANQQKKTDLGLYVIGGLVLFAAVDRCSGSSDPAPIVGPPDAVSEAAKPPAVIAAKETASAPQIPIGSTFNWVAEDAPAKVLRVIGPYTVRIIKRTEDHLVAPIVEVTVNNETVWMEGELASPSYTHRVSALQNRSNALPVVMLQSFSGGAHCCNHVQLAGLSGGRLKRVDLGSWDGGEIDAPRDISGDGVADFVMRDDRFLYAFAPYAMSFAPPQILNVIDGQVVDVSRQPAFRRLYSDTMREAGRVCLSGKDGVTRNGSCPAYLASAARVGELDNAWREMLAAYDPAANWDLPKGCRVKISGQCPSGYQISYNSYPEALLGFLRDTGYVEAEWQAPQSLSPGAATLSIIPD
jgi:hypothetical protein